MPNIATVQLPAPSQPAMPLHSARELLAGEPAPTPWLAEPWIVQGGITDLVGYSKAGGKTTFALAICRAICRGEPFLGKPTKQCAIVYLTEQRRVSFDHALRRASFKRSDPFYVALWEETISASDAKLPQEERWFALIRGASQQAHHLGAALIVLDTFGQFAMLENENDAYEVHRAASYLQMVAAHNFAILVLRHARKAGGDPTQAGRGSTAFAAISDVMATIARSGGNEQKIHAYSRFDETPEHTRIALVDGAYSIVNREVSLTDRLQEQVMDLLYSNPGLTRGDIAERLSITRKIAGDTLAKMELNARGSGKRGDPQRFYIKDA